MTPRGRPKKKTAIVDMNEAIDDDDDITEIIETDLSNVAIPTGNEVVEEPIGVVVEETKPRRVVLPPCEVCHAKKVYSRSQARVVLKERYTDVYECTGCIRIYVKGAGGFVRQGRS